MACSESGRANHELVPLVYQLDNSNEVINQATQIRPRYALRRLDAHLVVPQRFELDRRYLNTSDYHSERAMPQSQRLPSPVTPWTSGAS